MKFLRRDAKRFGKFGKGKGKKAKWRNPTGRHNKIREGKKGYQARVKIGYGKENNQSPIKIENVNDLIKINGEVLILGKVGKKKKIEIAKKAKEMNIKFTNFNPSSFMKKEEKEKKKDKPKTEGNKK